MPQFCEGGIAELKKNIFLYCGIELWTNIPIETRMIIPENEILPEDIFNVLLCPFDIFFSLW